MKALFDQALFIAGVCTITIVGYAIALLALYKVTGLVKLTCGVT